MVEAARPPRDAATLAAIESGLITGAWAQVATQSRVALLFSGGLESGLLLHLFRPMRDHLVVAWVNPGATAGDAEHVRQAVQGWPHFAEIPVDRIASWERHGLPTPLLPTAYDPEGQGDGPAPPMRLQPHKVCCGRIRWQPFLGWAVANGITLAVHGQRRGEGSALMMGPTASGLWAPLADWTREEVEARAAHHGIALPPQYAAGYRKSIECGVCPADLAPARLAFLREHYPEHHAETLRLSRVVFDAIDHAHGTMRDALAAAEGCAA